MYLKVVNGVIYVKSFRETFWRLLKICARGTGPLSHPQHGYVYVHTYDFNMCIIFNNILFSIGCVVKIESIHNQ